MDGSGKTTQARILACRLEEVGIPPLLTGEPTELLRDFLLHGDDLAPLAELFLFLADRAQHVRTVVLPALSEGKVVVCDRYADSTLAYQGYGRGLDTGLIRTLNGIATSGLAPDMTVLLDVPPEVAIGRKASEDRFEGEGLDFLRKVREGYLKLA
ncbi:MAG TPA: dTMP kinase, partial [Candidatus Latescibacteria bacterium]|nr:dTMP kinase [Candidatus Latescibacterota bacterium]